MTAPVTLPEPVAGGERARLTEAERETLCVCGELAAGTDDSARCDAMLAEVERIFAARLAVVEDAARVDREALERVLAPETVERAAREAFWTDDVGGHHKPGRHPHTWENIPEVGRENYRTLVRAVLRAALAQPAEPSQEATGADLAASGAEGGSQGVEGGGGPQVLLSREVVDHIANWVPLGFVPGKDPYDNVNEAARAILTEVVAVLEDPQRAKCDEDDA